MLMMLLLILLRDFFEASGLLLSGVLLLEYFLGQLVWQDFLVW